MTSILPSIRPARANTFASLHLGACIYVCVWGGGGEGCFSTGYHYLDCVYVNANACMAYTCEFLLYGLGHCKENCCVLYLHFTNVSLLHTTCIATLYNYNCGTCMCETNDVFKMEDTRPSYGTCKTILIIAI